MELYDFFFSKSSGLTRQRYLLRSRLLLLIYLLNTHHHVARYGQGRQGLTNINVERVDGNDRYQQQQFYSTSQPSITNRQPPTAMHPSTFFVLLASSSKISPLNTTSLIQIQTSYTYLASSQRKRPDQTEAAQHRAQM